MANCNCNDFPISCAPHAPGGDCCHPHGCPPHPCPPSPFKGGTSMYIGARYVPIFADPVEWDDAREYEPLTIVIHDGNCYTSKCYVPKGAQLPPYQEGQTKYWVKTSDYNYQFADLKKTVLDLSRLVEQFQKDNERFTELINGWNTKVEQWEKDMAAWGERLDTVESNIADLTASLNAEIDRAKAAEQANAAAIAQETADRKQAISDLDAAYKAADAAEAQARADGDAANAAAIAKETTDRKQAISELDAAYKAADAAEAQKREEADTALSNRITANKTDIDALKAEQAIQNTNISKSAKNISDNAAEIAKHAKRLTDLESNASDWDSAFPDTTIAQEVQKEELARTNADTALNGRCDAIAADVEEVRDIANHKVNTTTYTAGQAAQDAKISEAKAAADKANTTIGDWETDHPGQTISQCATSVENEIAAVDTKADANAANIGDWNTQHPGKTISQKVTDLSNSIPDVSGFVTETVYNQGQAAQDAKITALEHDKYEYMDKIAFLKSAYCQGVATLWDNGNPVTNPDFTTASPCTPGSTSLNFGAIIITCPKLALVTFIPCNDTHSPELWFKDNECRLSFDTDPESDDKDTVAITALKPILDAAELEPVQVFWKYDYYYQGDETPKSDPCVKQKTYDAGQAAQDARITAAQNAANKANATIGDWETEHPGKTIAQEVTRLGGAIPDVFSMLDQRYPPNYSISGTKFNPETLYAQHYIKGGTINSFVLPIYVPDIVTFHPELWDTVKSAPTSVTLFYGALAQNTNVISSTVDIEHSAFVVTTDPPLNIETTGVHHFRINGNNLSISWTKNSTPFTSLREN